MRPKERKERMRSKEWNCRRIKNRGSLQTYTLCMYTSLDCPLPRVRPSSEGRMDVCPIARRTDRHETHERKTHTGVQTGDKGRGSSRAHTGQAVVMAGERRKDRNEGPVRGSGLTAFSLSIPLFTSLRFSLSLAHCPPRVQLGLCVLITNAKSSLLNLDPACAPCLSLLCRVAVVLRG